MRLEAPDETRTYGSVAMPEVIDMQTPESSRKRLRKSRGKGLRTTSGCLTCRKRHKKCDERQPICGPCAISSRECVFAGNGVRDERQPRDAPSGNSQDGLRRTRDSSSGISPDPSVPCAPIVGDLIPPQLGQTSDLSTNQFGLEAQYSRGSGTRIPQALQRLEDEHQLQFAFSSDTIASDLLTADLASTRWLDLLAHDAAQADKTFSLAPTRCSSPVADRNAGQPSLQITRPASIPDAIFQPIVPAEAGTTETNGAATEQHSWQLDHDISLQSHEIHLFRTFVEHAASWLDLCDPQKHFSTHATRLALRNLGLMKAILALTSRHALVKGCGQNTDVNVPIQYYYETLHYVQESLQYATYARSEELLATVIIISTYEMLDDANSNWQRHLKGVFWIQRSQDVDGSSGGLRQAVWWAWLRQDLWAAFREKRACFSFWRPAKAVTELTQDELANRAIYLLSQAVNYFAHSESASVTVSQEAQKGETIIAALEQWRACLGPAFRPLPTPQPDGSIFKSIWIHPPQYAVATQAYHFATILVTLHRPATAGFQGYMQTQRVLSEAVNAICGIAMELQSEGCQILCAQCLFGAGLCTQDNKTRNAIIALIQDCEKRTGWPMSNLINDLRTEWAKLI